MAALGYVMRIEVTDMPCKDDEAFVIAQARAYNSAFTENDHQSLCVFARDDVGNIIGGLTGRTYWQYLDIAFLWVDGKYRGEGYATKLMKAAEAEARERGCERVFLDTLSFQALGFYLKLGYTEFGRLPGFSGKYDRHYLHKRLDAKEHV
jgi:ribosomal protein S18 acetylase RimI-like enzyme